MVYIIPLILFTIGIVRYDYLKINRGKLFLWGIICVYLILLGGLRYQLGEDTHQYIWAYDKINPLNEFKPIDFQRSRFAPGFLVIFAFFKMLSPEIVYFQLFEATVVNIVVFYFFYKNSKNIYFAGVIYYFFLYILFNFQELREAMAVSVFLLAWPAFKQNKWVIWYLASILAFSMHLSAIIMFLLPVITLPGVRNLFTFSPKKTAIIIIGILVVTYVIYQRFFVYIQLLAISDAMSERAQAYGSHDLGGALSNIKMVLATIFEYAFYPLIVLYILYNNNKNKKENNFNKLDAFVLCNIYVVFFSLFVIVGGRLKNYFFPFVILLLSDFIFSAVRVKGKKYAFNILFWFVFFLPMFALHSYRVLYTKINRSGTLRTYMALYPYNSYIYRTDDYDQEKTYQMIFRPNRRR
ncbi:MAG: EpsG family protein [Muribaculaceae bacterium]|nr:EpsG family protein [Muribaculaceae bacterium]